MSEMGLHQIQRDKYPDMKKSTKLGDCVSASASTARTHSSDPPIFKTKTI
jgi:hypothetical protein